MLSEMKQFLRRVANRVLDPYFAAERAHVDARLTEMKTVIGEAPSEQPSPPVDPILTDFNELFHRLRSGLLHRIPAGGTLLSAGCAGAWYFDWLAECAGPFERHIGVELYSPEPAELPDNVTWIAESASSMPGVPDDSVDVVFSGQNIEHLWIDDLVGFLTESNRVLRPGGTLVVDSPNRLATEALGWVHPEHTIEMTASEAGRLFELAGFSVHTVRGLWNCREPRTGSWMELFSQSVDAREIVDRAAGQANVDDCFGWWIEAERTADISDVDALRSSVTDLVNEHWPSRVNRAAGCGGIRASDGTWSLPEGSSGALYRTHGFPIFPGTYSVTCTPSRSDLEVRIYRNDSSLLTSGMGRADGNLAETEFGLIGEVFADEPLSATVDDVALEVNVQPASSLTPIAS